MPLVRARPDLALEAAPQAPMMTGPPLASAR